MDLPEFNEFGDLPEGVYPSTLAEVIARFGVGSAQRVEVTERLKRIIEIAQSTGSLDRVIVFGSYVTAKEEPNDVDVILMMDEDCEPEFYPLDIRVLFDHMRAHDELKASVFWARPSMIFGMTVQEFVASWQAKRVKGRRGILELRL